MEENSVKSRTGIYISKDLFYRRKKSLEGVDSHLVVIDIEVRSDFRRIINIYRCFNPQEGITPREKFKTQLKLIKNAMIPNTIVLGDFNLDYDKIYNDNYAHKLMFDDFESELSCFNLIQMVNFVTWSRMVGHSLRSSILDHVYINDPTVIKNLKAMKPYFGDHLMVEFCIDGPKSKKELVIKRDWRHYSMELLNY